MSDPIELKRLDVEITRLQDTLLAEQESSLRTRRVPLVISLVLLAIVLCFVTVNYLKIRSELTSEKLGRSLEKELREVSPTAFKEFDLLGKDLFPVYAAEWKKQLQASWPEISRKFQAELNKFDEILLGRIHKLLDESERRVLGKTEAVLFENYPQLKDEEMRIEVEKKLHTICDQALTKSLLDFDSLFTKDVNALQEVLLKFDVTDTNETTVDLQKKFLHLWLQLLDQEIMQI